VLLAVLVSIDGKPLVDEPGMDLAQSVEGISPLAWFFNEFMNSIGIPALWVASISYHGAMQRWKIAGFFAAAALIAPFTGVIKAIVDRPRPEGSFSILETPADPSFPSGHTTLAIGFFGSWFLLAPQLVPARWVLPVRIFCAGAIFMTAFSRLWVGAHWPTDVTASLFFGFAFLMTLAIVFGLHRADHKSPERELAADA